MFWLGAIGVALAVAAVILYTLARRAIEVDSLGVVSDQWMAHHQSDGQ